MVNRKSQAANFVQNGSPKKRLADQVIKAKIKNNHPKENKGKKNAGTPVTWDFAKEYFADVEKKRLAKLRYAEQKENQSKSKQK